MYFRSVTDFRGVTERWELSAPTTVMAILIAGMLTKLGHGWWGIAAMVALRLLGTVRKGKLATQSALPRHASEPVLG
jgi:hypothetical protein